MYKDRHIKVDAICEWCSKVYKVQRTKFNAGKAHFCSLVCAGKSNTNDFKDKLGFENGVKYKIKNEHRWAVRWRDKNNKIHALSYQKWWWTLNMGEVPDGMSVICKDGNSENINPENFILGTREDVAKINAFKQVGKVMPQSAKDAISELHKGTTLSAEHRQLIGDSVRNRWNSGEFDTIHVGKYNKKWKGGVHAKYSSMEYKRMCVVVRDRDNSTCQICGKDKLTTRSGHVHHLDRNTDNNDINNLLLLCIPCHGKVHGTYPSSPPIMAIREFLK